jgi:DNA-directed RNA polymerase specialized sigma24 family protein
MVMDTADFADITEGLLLYSQMIRLARRLLYDDEESRDVVSEVFITLINTDILSKNMEDYLIASFFMLITYNHA